jgi:hypothetical protein
MQRSGWAFGITWIGLIVGIVGAASADEKDAKIEAGFRCYIVMDKRYDLKTEQNRTGSFHCPVCEYGLQPVLAVFSRSIPAREDDPVVALIQRQDKLAEKYRAQRLGTFAVFLTLNKDHPDDKDREKSLQAVGLVAQQANVKNVLIGVAEATVEEEGETVPSPQVKAFHIGNEDDVTVILYHRMTVVDRWKFTKDKPLTAQDLDAVSAAVDQLLGKKKK